MKNIPLNRNELKDEIFHLMNKVSNSLKGKRNVDDFLDKTDLFDYWESILPDQEYPVFVITVLNNIKKDSIIDAIIDSIEKAQIPLKNNQNYECNNEFKPHVGEQPFN